jgi:hypothetical protein
MSFQRALGVLVIASIASMTVAVAQTTTQPDTTSPSSASSPHQRSATSTTAPEAQPANGADPSAAASPHQEKATRTANAKQSMKQCVAKQQADHAGMSTADAKKSCKAQMKSKE